MRKPISPAPLQPEEILPHEHDREARQPYAKEVEDYQAGVVTPPEEQAGRETGAPAPELPSKRQPRARA
jgi:hypothetical protein